MLFWVVCSVMTLVVAAIVVTPLLRPGQPVSDGTDIEIYRAQLAEIDRDVARALLAPEEAETARAEVARRLLAASKTVAAPQLAGRSRGLSIALVGCIGLIAVGTYWQIGAPGYGDLPLADRLATSAAIRADRPDQIALEAAAPPVPPVDVPDEYREAVAQLRIIAPTRPDDLQAWELLVIHETELRNFASAARAQAQVIQIKGAPAEIADQALQLDLMVSASGGLISPEAEALARQMLATDPAHPTARFYLGVLFDQTDRPDLAYRFWREMAETGDPETFHVARARAMIESAAFRAGIDYTLPTARGPSLQDIETAQDMTPQDRETMIGNMVAGLADRLANEGGTAADWARLIRAYGVLGDRDNAQMVWTEAKDVFGAREEAIAILTEAAQAAGLLE
ncbi:c-type cytochrome biogenesis protein CcmI [Yoonia sp. SS1-5]|uniref:C-type cytochrome biogenesis protein CcmI n=1 Tax=Yoonia rhodophyticola TaxID=3137370 RepID=A0AAN0M716_9RHOB